MVARRGPAARQWAARTATLVRGRRANRGGPPPSGFLALAAGGAPRGGAEGCSMPLPHARGALARSRQFTISKHKQNYEWLQVAWDAVATGLAGSKRWGRRFWDAKRLAWQSLSVSLRSRILSLSPGRQRPEKAHVYSADNGCSPCNTAAQAGPPPKMAHRVPGSANGAFLLDSLPSINPRRYKYHLASFWVRVKILSGVKKDTTKMSDNAYPFKALNVLCILAGCIIYAFGLKWCYQYARYFAPVRENQRPPKSLKFIEHCQTLFSRHPTEGSLKLIATAVGLAITLTADQPGSSSSSAKVFYATIYLFFAFSGLVDVLHFYFPYNVTKSLVKLALAQSFFAEGLLILHVYAISDFFVASLCFMEHDYLARVKDGIADITVYSIWYVHSVYAQHRLSDESTPNGQIIPMNKKKNAHSTRWYINLIVEMDEEVNEKIQISPPVQIVRVPVKHANLGIRSHAMDMSTMVELTSFSTLGKIQPFLVTITTTAALLVDLHCHLTDKEVCGYLGGHWDINSHNLSITSAFPCRYSGKDKSAAATVEAEIARAMEWKRVTLVGWYHSHPRSHASPSLRDVDSQLDYQIKMKGPSDNGYTPCVGLICSPYNMDGSCYESNFNVFWSLPPPENRPHEYPRPMLLSYTLSQEHFLSQDTLEEIRRCIEYYRSEGGIDFTANFNNNTTYLERLRCSLASKLPGRNRSNGSYWDVIREMICPGSEDGTTPEFLAVKFPLVPVSESLVPPVPPGVGLAAGNTAVFLTPVNFKPDGAIITPTSKPFVMQPSTSRDGIKKDSGGPTDAASITQIKDGSPILPKPHMSSSEMLPSFQSGELTVSVKNAKCDYDFGSADFTKLPNPLAADSVGKTRSTATPDFPLADITQQITKFSDLSKLANFSTADLAKLSGFSIADFTRTSSPSPSMYMRNIANLFGPLGKISPARDIDGNERKPGDFATVDAIQSPFKTTSSSESCRSFSISAEDYSSDRKKIETQGEPAKLNRSGDYQVTEDLSISSVKSDFGGMIDMTSLHKKQQSQTSDIVDSLNLSKDR
ncbi:hypothetical protein KM043_008460 [Ampulex compressa]|nr:hypothetical protein KM043_008460 [Ampulex compressa]